MEDSEELKKWYKVYVLNGSSPYIGFIEEYLNELYLQSFTIWRKLSQINPFFEHKKYFTLEETLELCKKFLKTLNNEYVEFLDEGLKNGSINIYDSEDQYDFEGNLIDGRFMGPYYSKYEIDHEDYTRAFKAISMPLKHNLDDTFALIHELFHASNANLSYDSVDWRVLTESVSITYEFILMDYLIKNDICNEENTNAIIFRMTDFLNKSKALAQGLIIFKKIKENFASFKDIKLYDVPDVKDEGEKEYRISKQKEEIYNNYKTLRKTLEYYLGTLIAILNYKKYKEGILDIRTIEKYSQSLQHNNQFESLDILFEKFPSMEEVKDAIDFVLEEINNAKNKNIKK